MGLIWDLLTTLAPSGAAVPVPSGFNYTPPVSILKTDPRTFGVGNYNIAANAPTGKAYYVSTTGSDANSGLTAGLPLASIATALGKADVDVVYVAAGTYHRGFSWSGAVLGRSVAVYATGGRVISTTAQPGLVWTVDGTLTNTYKVTRSNVSRVLDASTTDANGDYSELTKQTSAANVEANPGSWYLDGTNVLWVRTADSRAPDSNIWVLLQEAQRALGNITVYTENIDFVGGFSAFDFRNSGAGQAPKYYSKGCSYSFSHNNNALRIEGLDAVLQDCVAKKSPLDGFNYHALNSVVSHVVEINCVGRDNGTVDGVANDNGSTMHDSGFIVRVMGEYCRNVGPNVIESVAQSWNLGVFAHDSASDIAGADKNFDIDGQAWLDACTSSGSTYDLIAQSGATIYTRDLVSGGVNGGTGTITTY